MDGVSLVKRLVGVLLVVAGLVPLILGTWFASQLGSAGSARFTLPDPGADPVLITPQVLNRTDLPVRIEVEAPNAVVGVATPSDITAILGTATRAEITGVKVSDWSLTSATTGTGAPAGLGEIELWRERSEIKGDGALSVTQQTAPESVLIVPGKDGLEKVTLTWAHDTWFYQALVLAAAGGLLSTVGWLLVRPGRRTATKEQSPHV